MECQCVTNIALVTSLNHTTVPAALKKVNLCPSQTQDVLLPCLLLLYAMHSSRFCVPEKSYLVQDGLFLMRHFYHLFIQWVKLQLEKKVIGSIALVMLQ